MTENDGAFNDYFGSSVAISGYTLLVEASVKDDGEVSAYAFFLEGDILCDEGAKIIPRNGIGSGD